MCAVLPVVISAIKAETSQHPGLKDSSTGRLMYLKLSNLVVYCQAETSSTCLYTRSVANLLNCSKELEPYEHEIFIFRAQRFAEFMRNRTEANKASIPTPHPPLTVPTSPSL